MNIENQCLWLARDIKDGLVATNAKKTKTTKTPKMQIMWTFVLFTLQRERKETQNGINKQLSTSSLTSSELVVALWRSYNARLYSKGTKWVKSCHPANASSMTRTVLDTIWAGILIHYNNTVWNNKKKL